MAGFVPFARCWIGGAERPSLFPADGFEPFGCRAHCTGHRDPVWSWRRACAGLPLRQQLLAYSLQGWASDRHSPSGERPAWAYVARDLSMQCTAWAELLEFSALRRAWLADRTHRTGADPHLLGGAGGRGQAGAPVGTAAPGCAGAISVAGASVAVATRQRHLHCA